MIQVVLTMDTLELVPFEGTQLQRVEDFDASKFHIKELRIKDLHKNLCKKSPYFHVRLDSHKRISAAEPAEPNGELRRSSLGTSDADYETCEEDGVASVSQGPPLPDPSEHQRGLLVAEQQPSYRTSKRKTRLPGKFRLDSDSFSDFPERYARYYRRSTSKSKVKHPLSKEKLDPSQTQFFEVPIEAHEVDLMQCDAAATASSGDRIGLCSSKGADSYPSTPSQRKASTRPLKQIYHSPSSGRKRHPTSKQSRASVDYSECMEVSTDAEPSEGPTKTPLTRRTKLKDNSPDVHTKEIPPNGKRSKRDDSEFNERTSRTSGSKVREKKSKLTESDLQRTHNGPNGSTEIMPTRWRLNSPDASVEGILPTEKMRILESKLKAKKRRTIESKLKEKKNKILESEFNWRYYAPQVSTDGTLPMGRKYKTSDPSTGKSALESKSKDKKDRTVKGTGKEVKSRTLEGESKRRHSAPNASVDDVLLLKWRPPKGTAPLESKGKGNNNRTSESKLKKSTSRIVDNRSKKIVHDPNISSEKVLPLKRKQCHSDASMEEILPTDSSLTPDSKLKENISKASEIKTKAKKAKIIRSELKQSSHVPDVIDGKPARRARIPIRKLKSGYASDDGSSDVERDVDGSGVSYPTFATEMKHSNVITCFWMGIPADFSTRHMPDHDQFIVLQDAKGLKWEANYLARKKGLSGGWRRFALDHNLEMGDIVVFELVKPLKFQVHITKVSGGENTTAAVHHPARETPKKALKPQASIGTKRVSSLESAHAHFSNRKRTDKDVEGKLRSTKPCLAGADKKEREGGKSSMMPASKPNRLFYPGAFKKKRKVARKETDHYDPHNGLLPFEDCECEEMLETKRLESLPKFKRLSCTEDDSRDSNARMDLQELGLTVYEEPACVSSLELQKGGPISLKPGPKKKLRRVSYFYSTDEDQGNSHST
ncbi:unnamed protein product [Calypogeia fissa]